MKKYVFALAPPQGLYSKLSEIKNFSEKEVGPQQYLEDEPHLTIYLSEFLEFENWKEDLESFLKTIFQGFNLKISGWEIFSKDPVTKKTTLTCGLDDCSKELLINFQLALIDYLKKFKVGRVNSRYHNMSSEYEKNIAEYGFPFVGKVWKPHFSIASFDESSFKLIYSQLKERCPMGNFFIDSLVVYELSENDNLKKIYEYRI